MLDINGALKAIGYGLQVLFFSVCVFNTLSSFAYLNLPVVSSTLIFLRGPANTAL